MSGLIEQGRPQDIGSSSLTVLALVTAIALGAQSGPRQPKLTFSMTLLFKLVFRVPPSLAIPGGPRSQLHLR